MPRIYQYEEKYAKTDFQTEIRRQQGEQNLMSCRALAQAAKIPHSTLNPKINDQVYNPGTGDFVQLAEGTRITQPKNHIMAGHGRERPIDCLDWLVDKYGGDAVKWTKEKGFGYIEDEYGDVRQVELHWYQEPSVGKVEMKIKYRDGRAYLDD